MKFFITLFFALTLTLSLTFAQEVSQTSPEDKWTRIESPSKDLSISFPSGFMVDNEDGAYRIYGHKNGAAMLITMNMEKISKSEFKRGLSYWENRNEFVFFTSGDFIGVQIKREDNTKEDFYMWLYMASSKGIYTISINSKDIKNNVYHRFLYSLRLNDKPLFTQNSDFPPEERNVLISLLKTDEIVLKALRQENSRQKKLEKAAKEEMEKEAKKTDYSRGMILLRKPKPSYTDSARQRGVQGTVKLRASFLANGQLGTIKLVSSLDRELDRTAFEAARKIKFIPAEVDGEPIDVTRFIEYNFTIY